MKTIIFVLLFMFQRILSRSIVGKKPLINVKNMVYDQCIISNKKKSFICQPTIELYLKQNDFLKDKKLISISPGGLKGFYLMGITSYMKSNYDLNNYIFSGASAGAWNALFMTFNENPEDIASTILYNTEYKDKNILEIEQLMKASLLNKYSEKDFDLNRLFIGVTSMNSQTNIYSDFDNLEDALDCCIASSHIPFITGGLVHKYQNNFAFDGGFSKYPYLNIMKSDLHITPSMWNDTSRKNVMTYYTSLFSAKDCNFVELYDKGFNDAKKNKLFLNFMLDN